MRPAPDQPARRMARRQVEATEKVIEHPVHLAMEREKRVLFRLTRNRHVPGPAPGDQIGNGHLHLHHCHWRRSRSEPFGSLLFAIWIWRGFNGSGTSRTRSMVKRPFAIRASRTCT